MKCQEFKSLKTRLVFKLTTSYFEDQWFLVLILMCSNEVISK